jgi:hypothetical protein
MNTKQGTWDAASDAVKQVFADCNPQPRAGEHTKGPWKAVTDTVHTLAGAQIADCSFTVKAEANARRIVACVNACEGIPEGMLGNIANWLPMIERERELVELIEQLANGMEQVAEILPEVVPYMSGLKWMPAKARAVIAKVKP